MAAAGERRPQPGVAAHEAPAVAQVRDQRAALGMRAVAPGRATSSTRSPPPSGTSRSPAGTRRPRPRPRPARRPAPGPPTATTTAAPAGPARWPGSGGPPRGSPAPARRTPARGTRCPSRRSAQHDDVPQLQLPAEASGRPAGPPTTRAAGRRRRSSHRRSSRSLATPPINRNVIVGTVIAIPTSDIPVGPPPLMAYTCHAKATRNAPSPSSDAVAPVHSSRKSRSRSGVRSEPDAGVPPGRIRPGSRSYGASSPAGTPADSSAETPLARNDRADSASIGLAK